MINNFVFYVHSDILDSQNFIDDKIDTFIRSINPILNIGRKLKAKIYYSSDDIELLRGYFDEPSFNKDFSKSQANKLDLLIDDFIRNKEVGNFFNVHFADEKTCLEPISMAFINSREVDKTHVIFNLAENSLKNIVLMVRSNEDFERMEVNYFSQIKDIWEFINKKMPPREYNFSPKHGNDIKKAIAPKSEKASQLLCSDGNALALLKTAIFDLREGNWCYNFDEQNETFIVFPCEGDNPQNKFHAYHIDKNRWRQEIPHSIIKYFGK